MKRPTPDEMDIAAQWLEANEGTEAQACSRVAAWLLAQAEATELRKQCRAVGVSVVTMRKRLPVG